MKVINQHIDERFTLYLGDSCEVMKAIPSNSIHYSIYSPPFAQLYVYSNSERDLGNNKSADDFYTHYKFILKELYRALIPGRLMSIHCMDLPLQKARDGFIGLSDFPGEITRMCKDIGFIYHSKVTIWKDPVVEMQRTKALGLLHKQIKKDSTMCRQGLSDYIITFRKQGENSEPVENDSKSFPVEIWQNYASPVWLDINQSNTLQRTSAREFKDEKHIAPLQLDVIERCIKLWTNPNDIILTPFAGIGSEVVKAIEMGRRGIGIELKESYYKQAVLNCKSAQNAPTKQSLF